MNLRFWKKKKIAEENAESAADQEPVVEETDQTPAKPGWLTRLKKFLKPVGKKSKPVEEDEHESPASRGHTKSRTKEEHPKDHDRRTDKKHPDEETEPPVKLGWLARLKTALLPVRKKGKPGEGEEPESPTSRDHIKPRNREENSKDHDRRTNKKHPDEETEPPVKLDWLARLKAALLPARKKSKPGEEEETEQPARPASRKHRDEAPEPPPPPARKSRKRLLVLTLLIVLAAGGGFTAREWMPPLHKEDPKAPAPAVAPADNKNAAAEPAPKPIDNTVPAPQAGAETAPAAPQPEQGAATQPFPEPLAAGGTAAATAEVLPPSANHKPPLPAEAQSVEITPPAAGEIQTQIEELKKQNQAMQAQIEALQKQKEPAAVSARQTRAGSPPPKDGVLIIGGKNAKESARSLKKVIEEMNGPTTAKEPEKK